MRRANANQTLGLLFCRRRRTCDFALSLLVALAAGTGVAVADKTHIIAVNTSCSAFGPYVRANQSQLGGAEPGGSNDTFGAADWDFHISNPQVKMSKHLVPKSKEGTFHCQCSGEDVENYERDCPKGMKCFPDSHCPAGRDCANHSCVDADVVGLNPDRNSVDVNVFHWSPQNGTRACQQSMTKYNGAVDAHEEGHAQQYRRDIDDWIKNHPASSFHRHECGPDVQAISDRLSGEVDRKVHAAIDELNQKLNQDTDDFHKEHGTTVSLDCSCGER
jgi:hypothetical protein